MSSTACIVCVITMRYSGAAARSSSSPGVMLEEPAGGHRDRDAGPGRNAEEPAGSGQRTTALGVRVIASRSPGCHRTASVIPRFVTLPERSTRPMVYSMEVSRGSRGRWLSGIGRGGSDALLRTGRARALMICCAAAVSCCSGRECSSVLSPGGLLAAGGLVLDRRLEPRIRRVSLLRMRGPPRASCGIAGR